MKNEHDKKCRDAADPLVGSFGLTEKANTD